MSIDIEDAPSRQTSTSLVSGILGDLQHLIQQQLLLTRREVESELRQWAAAGLIVAAGAAMLLIAGVVLCLAVSHLLYWVLAPSGTDPAGFPLWASHGAAATAFAALGAVLIQTGRAKFKGKPTSEKPVQNDFVQEPSPWSTRPK
jgi:hypothetical protein